jgi:hypothetical protein
MARQSSRLAVVIHAHESLSADASPSRPRSAPAQAHSLDSMWQLPAVYQLLSGIRRPLRLQAITFDGLSSALHGAADTQGTLGAIVRRLTATFIPEADNAHVSWQGSLQEAFAEYVDVR